MNLRTVEAMTEVQESISSATALAVIRPMAVPQTPDNRVQTLSSSMMPEASVFPPSQTMFPVTSAFSTSDISASNIKSKTTHKAQAGMNGGRWTELEHQSFLAGLRLYGREWKKVASKIKTRTSAQIRSHAQKYFAKLARDDEVRKHGGVVAAQDGVVGAQASVTNTSYGYFSDGGSSGAVNSGDDGGETDSNTALRATSQLTTLSIVSTPSDTKCIPPVVTAHLSEFAPSSRVTLQGNIAMPELEFPQQSSSRQSFGVIAKKRSRSQIFTDDASTTQDKSCLDSFKRPKSMDAREVQLLPSQEELLEKVSPNVRQRLSSLIEAEICALQVLSCYALLQRQDKERLKPATKLPMHSSSNSSSIINVRLGPNGTVFASPTAMNLAMITTEQIPPTRSIY